MRKFLISHSSLCQLNVGERNKYLIKNYFSELQKDTKSITYRRRHCHVLEMVTVGGVIYPVISVVPTEEEEYIPDTAYDKIKELINGEKI